MNSAIRRVDARSVSRQQASCRLNPNTSVRRTTRCVIAAAGLEGKQVLIIGGTGRVGSSTASALLSSFPGIKVTLASRSAQSYERAVAQRPELRQTSFQQLDVGHAESVQVSELGHAPSRGPMQLCTPCYCTLRQQSLSLLC